MVNCEWGFKFAFVYWPLTIHHWQKSWIVHKCTRVRRKRCLIVILKLGK